MREAHFLVEKECARKGQCAMKVEDECVFIDQYGFKVENYMCLDRMKKESGDVCADLWYTDGQKRNFGR